MTLPHALKVWPTREEPFRECGPFSVELLGAEPRTMTAGWTVQHVALRLGGDEQRVMVAQMQWQDMTAQVCRAGARPTTAQCLHFQHVCFTYATCAHKRQSSQGPDVKAKNCLKT